MTNEDKPVEELVENVEFTEEDNVDEVAQEEISTDLESQLEKAQEEAAKYKDNFVRSEAEMANLRRRAEKDVTNAHKFGLEKLSKELLNVADNLERTIVSAEGEVGESGALKEGVEMTLKGLLDLFSKFNIETVNPEGAPFDPQYHQAVSMIENPDVEPNTVIAVMQKGYLLNERLIRPAMVLVSKGGESATKIDETA